MHRLNLPNLTSIKRLALVPQACILIAWRHWPGCLCLPVVCGRRRHEALAQCALARCQHILQRFFRLGVCHIARARRRRTAERRWISATGREVNETGWGLRTCSKTGRGVGRDRLQTFIRFTRNSSLASGYAVRTRRHRASAPWLLSDIIFRRGGAGDMWPLRCACGGDCVRHRHGAAHVRVRHPSAGSATARDGFAEPLDRRRIAPLVRVPVQCAKRSAGLPRSSDPTAHAQPQ